MVVVLAHPVCLWGQELVLDPSPAPTVCPLSLSSNRGVMQEGGEPSSCNSSQQMQGLNAQHAAPCTQFPRNPTANSLPGHNDTFQQHEVSPIGLQPKPSGIWGSLQPSQAPWVLVQLVLEPGSLTLSPSALPCSSCASTAAMKLLNEGLSFYPSPKRGCYPSMQNKTLIILTLSQKLPHPSLHTIPRLKNILKQIHK